MVSGLKHSAILLSLLMTACSSVQTDDSGIAAVLLHPPFAEAYRCSEHRSGQLPHLGDSLGADCSIGRLVEANGRMWIRSYQNDGRRNEDWFGYGADVLSPCECNVVEVRINIEENLPGTLGNPPASSITLAKADGTRIMLAHIKDPRISKGDSVEAGEILASVGNNGYSRQPHIHIGAWRDETALQIRFDQTKMKQIAIVR